VDPLRSEQADPNRSPVPGVPDGESASIEPASRDGSSELGLSGKSSLVAVPVGPYVVHCQWEAAPADIEGAKQVLGVGEHEYWPVLQFYDVTAGAEAAVHPSFSVEVKLEAGNWYVYSCCPDRSYRADLTLKAEEGSFTVIASSNLAVTPPSSPSSDADAQWLPIRLPPQPAHPVPSPFSSAQQASAAPTIDMSEEVRRTLVALYGEPIREIFVPPSAPSPPPADRKEQGRSESGAFPEPREAEALEPRVQSPLPIDMREEVEGVLRRIYQGLELDPPHPVGASAPAVLLRVKRDAIADLTELNERSFSSGVSSRME